MDMAYAWADRVAVFAAGKILIEGTPDEVFGAHDFCARSGLRLPIIYRLSRELEHRGLISAGDGMPRGLPDLLARLTGAKTS